MATPLGEFADFIKSEYEANKPAVLAAIQAGEGGAEAFLVNLIQNAQFSGVLGMIASIVKPQAEAFVQGLVTKYGPEVVYAFIDAEIAAEAKRLGG